MRYTTARFVGAQANGGRVCFTATRSCAFGRDVLQLIDVRQNRAQIGGQTLEFARGEFQLSQFCNVLDLF